MLLSGFYFEEADMMKEAGAKNSLEFQFAKQDNNWALVCLKKC